MSDETLPVSALRADTRNPRKRTPRNLRVIEQSLREFGPARSIVIDEDNKILAGNGVGQVLARAGVSRVRVVEAQPGEVVAVRKRGLTEDEKHRLAVADNRAGELADWDRDILREDAQTGALDGYFNEEEIAALSMPPPSPERIDVASPPPTMAWTLIGVPLARYDEVAALIEQLRAIAEVTVMTTRGAQ